MVNKTLISVGLKLTSLALGFGTTVLLVRLLSKSDFGTYSMLISASLILGVFVQFGMPTLATRELARLSDQRAHADIRSFKRFSLQLILALSVLLAVITATVFWLDLTAYDLGGLIVVLMLAMVLLNSLIKLFCGQIRGHSWVISSQLPELIIRPAAFFLLLLAASFFVISLESTLWIYCAAAATGLLFSLFCLQRIGSQQEPAAAPSLKPASQAASTSTPAATDRSATVWIKSGVPLMLAGGVVIINQNLDTLLLGTLATTEDVAQYRVCARLTALIAFGLAAVSAVQSPVISRLYHAGSIQDLETLVRKGALLCLLIALPLVAVMTVAPQTLLLILFGSEYRDAATVLIILSLGQLANAAFGILGVLLNMTGHERCTLIGVFVALSASVLLNLVLVPQYGAIGAAIAQSLSLLTWNVILAYFVFSRLQVSALPFLPRVKQELGV